MTDLTTLPNIGDKLADELQRVGITSAEQLVELGSEDRACVRAEYDDRLSRSNR